MKVHFIPVDENETKHWIIYRPLLKLAFVGNRAMVELAEQAAVGEAAGALPGGAQALGFLEQVGYFDPEPAVPPIEKRISAAVLLLTNRCQLRCTYCYASGGEFEARSLALESGKTVIDYVYEQARANGYREFHLEFHGGGEPSLEWQTLQALTAHARAKHLPSRIKLTSNTIWSEDQCRWIIDNLDGVSVSMDGSPATQDRQRPFRNHKPSSQVVMRSLQAMDRARFPYGIRMTACSPWSQLVEDVRFILENSACRAMHVEPAFVIQRGTHLPPSEDQHRQFAAAFLEAYTLADQHQAVLTYSGARPEALTQTFCLAPYNAVVINPDNDLVACYEIVDQRQPLSALGTFGSLRDGQVWLEQARRERLYGLMQARREATCRDCFCQSTCAGDCFTRTFDPGPEGHLAVTARCAMNREITRGLLLARIHKHGGVWNGKRPLQILAPAGESC